MRIGRRIAEAREAAGLTQAELAAKIPGKSDGTQISKWERGVHRPGDDTLEQIAVALEKDVAWFLIKSDEAQATGAPDLMRTLTPGADPSEQLAEISSRLNRLQAVLEELAGEKVVAAALAALARAEQPDAATRRRRAA